MIPIEKYTFVEIPSKETVDGVEHGPVVVAISSYAGRTVKGVAKCHPSDMDNYSLAEGSQLAATRCAVKVAEKRVKRANKKVEEALEEVTKANKFLCDMLRYQKDANRELLEVKKTLSDIEE